MSNSVPRLHNVGERCYLVCRTTKLVIDVFPSKGLGNGAVRRGYETLFGLPEGSYVSVIEEELHNHV